MSYWWQRRAQSLTGSALGSRLASRWLPRVDRTLLRASDNRFSLSSWMIDVPVIVLTTTGAKTGLPRRVPLLAFPEGDDLVVIASSFGNPRHPAWYLNLRANPAVQVTFHGSRPRLYWAREAEGEERRRYWQRASQAYPGYEGYRQRAAGRQIPVIVLTPSAATEG